MSDSTPYLAAVPADAEGPGAGTPRTTSAPLPAETSPVPERAPDLLAALDAGDEEAVLAWVVAHIPEPRSLAVYGLLLVAGVAGLIEWPVVTMTMLAHLVVDRRLGGLENVVAELRALAEGRERDAATA